MESSRLSLARQGEGVGIPVAHALAFLGSCHRIPRAEGWPLAPAHNVDISFLSLGMQACPAQTLLARNLVL